MRIAIAVKAAVLAATVLASSGMLVAQTVPELPRGWGNAVQGVFLFKDQCSVCHSELDTYDAAANTGLCFIDPTRLFHYVKRTMPPGAAGSLKDTDVYALVAYVLEMKRIIKRGDIINAKTLPNIVLLNQGGMISSSCPKEAGGLGKGNVTANSPKTMPAMLPATAAPPSSTAPKAKPAKLTPTKS